MWSRAGIDLDVHTRLEVLVTPLRFVLSSREEVLSGCVLLTPRVPDVVNLSDLLTSLTFKVVEFEKKGEKNRSRNSCLPPYS